MMWRKRGAVVFVVGAALLVNHAHASPIMGIGIGQHSTAMVVEVEH
jgi:hypothetical protein